MKIEAHCSLYAPHIGGVETMTAEMGHALAAQGHEMSVVTKRWPDTLAETEVVDKIQVQRVPAGISEAAILDTARYFAANPDLVQSADVVHLIGMRRPLPLFGTLLAAVHGKPVVSSVVGSEVPNLESPESATIWQEGEAYMHDAYRNILGHTAVSASTMDLATAVVPYIKDKIKVLPVGIDVESYDQFQAVRPDGIDEPFIMSLRRLEKSKGIDVLIKAYAQLIAEGRAGDTQLVIAGDGPERQNLEKLAADLLGRDVKRTHFLGRVSLQQGIGMLKTAAATVVPSIAEGGGLVNTEANAVGCPLIASDVGGIREYTTPESSILFEAGNSSELAKAIHTILNDSGMRAALTANGRCFAETRDWQKVIMEYIAMYEMARPLERKDLQVTSNLGKKVLNILEGNA